jgi:hypothetical protein
MERGAILSRKDGSEPLSLWERVGVRGYGLSSGSNPSPELLRNSTSPHGRGEESVRVQRAPR